MKVLKWIGVVLFVVLCLPLSAQGVSSNSIHEQVTALSEKYKGERGVKSLVATDGFKLQSVKMMLRKEFGKEFVDNIKMFAIMFYKEANSEVAKRIVSDVEQIVAPLRNIDINNQLRPGAKGQGYVRLLDDEKRLTDLLIVMEYPSPRLIYFGGDFQAEDVKYTYK